MTNGRNDIKNRRELLDKLDKLEDGLDELDATLTPLKVGGSFDPSLPREAIDAINLRFERYGLKLSRLRTQDSGNS